jgi:hypothetical protein
MYIQISYHAKEQIKERGLSLSMVLEVVENPDQKFNNDIHETVCQSIVTVGDKSYLLRVFVNYSKSPPLIISAYRTRKINKYWSI